MKPVSRRISSINEEELNLLSAKNLKPSYNRLGSVSIGSAGKFSE
jgi:hypothetical protein